jgi:death-on-curing protein
VNWHWLQEESVLALHNYVLELNGGSSGVRDKAMFHSALSRLVDKAGHGDPSLSLLAAAYAFGISQNHPFTDGNERTAFMAMALFLERNGWTLVAAEVEAAQTILALAAGELQEGELAEWIEAHSVALS